MASSFSLKGGSGGGMDSKGGRTTTAATTPDVGALRVGHDWTRSVPEVGCITRKGP